MNIKAAVRRGWAVKIWPHHQGVSVVFSKANELERIGRSGTVKQAVKVAWRSRLQVRCG